MVGTDCLRTRLSREDLRLHISIVAVTAFIYSMSMVEPEIV